MFAFFTTFRKGFQNYLLCDFKQQGNINIGDKNKINKIE